MDDGKRLDAIGEYGLCIATYDQLTKAGWERTWVCQYQVDGEPRVIFGENIREVLDAAILEFTDCGVQRH